MLVIVIILFVLLVLALLRVGVILEYSEDGFNTWIKLGFLKLKLKKSDEKKKPKKKKKPKDKGSILKPGSLRDFMDMLKAIKVALGRLKRKLLIKNLTLHYTSASDDPAKTALRFGAANAVFGAIVPVLEKHFRIKKRDLRASADFNSQEQGIYVRLNISIAVWEIVYVLLALLPLFKTASLSDTGKPEKEKTDGKSTNKQSTGDHDAKNKGDD